MATNTPWYDSAWDTVSGAFDKFIDFESFKYETDLMEDRRRSEATVARQTAPVAAPTYGDKPISMNVVAGGILLLAGALYIYKKA